MSFMVLWFLVLRSIGGEILECFTKVTMELCVNNKSLHKLRSKRLVVKALVLSAVNTLWKLFLIFIYMISLIPGFDSINLFIWFHKLSSKRQNDELFFFLIKNFGFDSIKASFFIWILLMIHGFIHVSCLLARYCSSLLWIFILLLNISLLHRQWLLKIFVLII